MPNVSPMATSDEPAAAEPPVLNYLLSFLLVSLAWGFTTPFMRAAARAHRGDPAAAAASAREPASASASVLRERLRAALRLLRDPRYALPLLLNLTGSVWFFLLIGRAELSLTVPIVNTLAFLFTVLGEWYVDGKVISKETGIGMVLSLTGIALCVHSKS